MKLLSFDIGGTFIKYAMVDAAGELYDKGKIPTPKNSRAELVEAVGGIFDRFAPDAVTVSMPGIIDTERGYVRIGGILEYNNDCFLRSELTERCKGVRVELFNDAKCAAQAEASRGALRDVKDGLAIVIGSMVGSGIVLDHRVRHGMHFAAGEVAYLVTDRASAPGYPTVWGNRCSALQLCRLYAAKTGLDGKSVTGETVFDALEAGDADADAVLRDYTRELAVQLFNLQTTLDVERIAIGGGISARAELMEYLQKNLDELYAASPFFVPRAELVRCRFQNDANLIGAAECFKMKNAE